MAPDVERMEGDGGLDDKASEIVNIARGGGLPVVFALNRWDLMVAAEFSPLRH